MTDIAVTDSSRVAPRNRVGRKPLINRALILETAATFHLEELSVSGVAAKLGVSHTSIYNYFDNRAALIAAVRAQVGLTMSVPEADGRSWQDWLVDAGFSARELMMTSLVGDSLITSGMEAACVPLLETFVEVLHTAGFTAEQTFAAYQLFMGGCIGAAIQARRAHTLQLAIANGDSYEPDEWLDGFGVAPDSRVREMFTRLGATYSIDDGFRRELHILVAGLERQLKDG